MCATFAVDEGILTKLQEILTFVRMILARVAQKYFL